jgi:hypothetical protein
MERVWHVRTRLDAAAPSGKGAYHNALSVGRGFQLLQVHPQVRRAHSAGAAPATHQAAFFAPLEITAQS